MRQFLFVFILIRSLLNAQVPPVCFKAATVYSTGVSPWSSVSAHFNSDGFKDIAVACDDRISICLAVGNGSFAPAVSYTVASGSILTSIVSGDFNSDGKADLAATSYASGSVYVWFGNGTGTFSPYVTYFLFAFAGPWGLATADFNNDGKLDLAAANVYPNNISVLINSGTGTFAAPVNYPVSSYPISITAADFNNDGKIDLATANYTSSNVSILMGSSSGTFATAVTYPAGTNPRSITSADFNGDNKIDIAVANYGSANISVLMGTGSGSFSSTVNYNMGGSPRGITTADFNGDGHPDIAAADWSSINPAVFLGSTTGTFSPAVYFAAGSSDCMVISDDFNNDGKPDMVLPSGSTNVADISVLLNGFNFNVNSGSVCIGQSYTINPSGAVTYTYSSGNAINTPTVNSSYIVTATNATGCISSEIVTVTVNSLPTINALTSSSLICNEQTAILTASGAITYSWNTNATTTVIAVTPTITTSYTVNGTDINGCSNYAVITQSVSSCTEIYKSQDHSSYFNIYPNPNNGEFTITADLEVHFSILNSLGQLVKTISVKAANNYKALVTDLPNGIYFITSSENKEIKQKIVVSK